VVVNQRSVMGRPGVDVNGRLEDWSFEDISNAIGRRANPDHFIGRGVDVCTKVARGTHG